MSNFRKINEDIWLSPHVASQQRNMASSASLCERECVGKKRGVSSGWMLGKKLQVSQVYF